MCACWGWRLHLGEAGGKSGDHKGPMATSLICHVRWGSLGVNTRNVAKVPPTGSSQQGKRTASEQMVGPRVTGTEAIAPKRRAFTLHEGRALAWGL